MIFLGLVVAVLASRVRYESIIKAVVFLPMAIAATALAIIWNFVYARTPISACSMRSSPRSPIAASRGWGTRRS